MKTDTIIKVDDQEFKLVPLYELEGKIMDDDYLGTTFLGYLLKPVETDS